MSQPTADVQPYPVVLIEITETSATVNGDPIDLTDGTPPHVAAVRHVAQNVAKSLNRPVKALATDPHGRTSLVIHPNGAATDAQPAPETPAPEPASETPDPIAQATAVLDSIPLPSHEPAPPAAETIANPFGGNPLPTATPTPPPTGAVAQPIAGFTPALAANEAVPSAAHEPAPPVVSYTPTPEEVAPVEEPAQQGVKTFLVRDQVTYPAEAGLRGTLNKLGLKLDPTDSEMGLRRAVRIISQHWAGVRTVAVVNAKGSASKTPTTIGLSAAFAIHGGGGVTAVDNNPTRGTLGWRTEQGPHEASVTDLIPYIEGLLRADASGSQMSAYLHHQTEDRYDVLRSKPERLGPPFTAAEFDQVVRVLSKYSRILVFDSGNDETADVWKHMIAGTNQLVVPTLARREWAEAARLLLEELSQQDEHGARLVANAVVLVSQADERKGLKAAQDIAAGFEGVVRATAVIPYDPHMVEGHMRWNGMARTTRDAWIRAAALVAQGF